MFLSWKNIAFKWKVSILVIALLAFTVVTGIAYNVLVEKLRDMSLQQTSEIMSEDYKNELKDLVDIMATTLGQAVNGVEDEKQIYRIFSDNIRKVRFFSDKSGYYFIYRAGGINFVHAAQPNLENKDLNDFRDPFGKPLIRELENASKKGGGFVDYYWEKPGSGLEPKLAYARMIPGDRYWIGTGVYIDSIKERRNKIVSNTREITNDFHQQLMLWLGIAFVVLAIPLIVLLVRSIVRPVDALTAATESLSRGKFDSEIPGLERRDELGKLAKAVERLNTSMKLAMARVRGNATVPGLVRDAAPASQNVSVPPFHESRN